MSNWIRNYISFFTRNSLALGVSLSTHTRTYTLKRTQVNEEFIIVYYMTGRRLYAINWNGVPRVNANRNVCLYGHCHRVEGWDFYRQCTRFVQFWRSDDVWLIMAHWSSLSIINLRDVTWKIISPNDPWRENVSHDSQQLV